MCVQDFTLANKTCLVCEYVPQTPLQLLQGAQSSADSPDQAPQPTSELLAVTLSEAWQHYHADAMFQSSLRSIVFPPACDD